MRGHWCWSPEGLFALGSSSSHRQSPASRMSDGSASTPVSQSMVVPPGKPLSWLHTLLCSEHLARRCHKNAPLVNHPGNHLIACRGNMLPLLLLWCSGKGAYFSDYFLPPQMLHVLHKAGTAKARGAAMARVWAVERWLGAMERSWMEQRWDVDGGPSPRRPCSSPALAWLDARDAKMSSWSSANWTDLKWDLFEIGRVISHGNKLWSVLAATTWKCKQILGFFLKYLPCFLQLLQVLWLGSTDINDGGGGRDLSPLQYPQSCNSEHSSLFLPLPQADLSVPWHPSVTSHISNRPVDLTSSIISSNVICLTWGTSG